MMMPQLLNNMLIYIYKACALVYVFFFFLLSTFSRHYLLDLMSVTPRNANYTGPGSRLCILRPELITAFCQVSNDILILTTLWNLFYMFHF